jgi:uncharacterized membrane protein
MSGASTWRELTTTRERDRAVRQNGEVTSGRMEAFSDGVMAILITIMVLELDVPHGTDLHALRPLVPIFLTYVLSFVHLGIYWNNHHHLLQATKIISAGVLWANLLLLFWLSLLPFATGWVGENDFAKVPSAMYGVVLLATALSYYVLQGRIVAAQQDDSLAKALGDNFKGKVSPAIYSLGIAASFVNRFAGLACYVLVALMWLVPDRRVEPVVTSSSDRAG